MFNKKTLISFLKLLLLTFPIFLSKYIYDIRTEDYSTFENWGYEDGSFEAIQFVCFFLASIIGFVTVFLWRKKKENLMFALMLLFSSALFFLAMEEISWGQRVWDISTSGIFEKHNVQHEMNFHNMSQVYDLIRYAYLGLGFWGVFSWIVEPLIPRFQKRFSFISTTLKTFIIPWYLTTYFVMLLINLANTIFLAPQDLEYFELLSAIGIFLFASIKFLDATRFANNIRSNSLIDTHLAP